MGRIVMPGRRFMCLFGMLWSGTLLGAPQTPTDPALWISGEYLAPENGRPGHALSLKAVIDPEFASSGLAGFSYFDFLDTSWLVLTTSLVGRPGERFIVTGEAELGPGESDGSHFFYRKATAGFTWIANEHVYLSAHDTYVDIADTLGHVAGVDASWRAAERLTLGLGLSSSIGNRIDTRQAMLRMDYHAGYRYFAGIAAGETSSPILLGEAGTFEQSRRLQQAFAGLEVPLSRLRLILAVDFLDLAGEHRLTVNATLGLPLSGGGHTP